MNFNWIRAKNSKACPVCGGKSGCDWTAGFKEGTTFVQCLRQQSGSLKTKTTKFGVVHIHIIDGSFAPVRFDSNISSSAPQSLIIHTYKQLLTGRLSFIHKQYLKARRVSRETIESCLYTSIPDSFDARDNLAKELSRHCDLEGVPGFWYTTYGQKAWRMNGPGGIAMAVRNENGEPVGIQINTDKAIMQYLSYTARAIPIPTDKLIKDKYMWLSSTPDIQNHKRLTGAQITPHVHCGITRRSELDFDRPDLLIVEGIFKRDLVDMLWVGDEEIRGTPGINACHKEISNMCVGSKRILIARDRDYFTNPRVKQGTDKLIETITSAVPKQRVYFVDWDTNYKGLDDALFAGINLEINHV